MWHVGNLYTCFVVSEINSFTDNQQFVHFRIKVAKVVLGISVGSKGSVQSGNSLDQGITGP